MAQDPWAEFRRAPTQTAPQPQADPILKAADPYKGEDQQIKRNAEARAQQDQAFQAKSLRLQEEAAARAAASEQRANDPLKNATEGERNNEAYYKRALRALETYDNTGVGPRTFTGQAVAELPGGDSVLRALPDAIGDSPKRRISEQAKKDFAAAILRSDSGANAPEPEVERLVSIYFPSAGETDPEVLKNYDAARREALKALRDKAGKLGAILPDYAPQPQQGGQTGAKDPNNQDIYGAADTGIKFGGGSDGGPFDRGRYLQNTYGIGEGDEAKIVAFWNKNAGNPGLTPEAVKQWYTANGYTQAMPTDEQIAGMVQQSAKGQGFGGFDVSGAEKAYIDRLKNLPTNAAREGADAGDLVQQGLMANLGDEASGVGGFIGSALTGQNPVEGYYLSRDAERLRLEQARQQSGGLGTAAELLGAAASGGANAPNALVRLLPNQLAKEGSILGGLQGFGSGEGAQGSAVNALLGTAVGGAVGAFGDKANALIANRTANRAAPSLDAAELARAGQAEGITVNRAMVNPRSNNRVTTADASLVGGPRVQAGMQEIEGQFARRVDEIGGNGTPLDKIAEGDVYRNAAERAIRETGDIAKRRYDKAAQLAGDTKVTPRESVVVIDEMLTKLGETANRNSKEITFLQGMKDDLSKNLSVGALRDLRTDLRKRISSGDLVFGQNEARVLDIMDAASTDIRNGLQVAGKTAAAKAFDVADKAYRARMEYINGTLQKVIGKRGATLSSEQIAQKVASMSKTDAKGFRRFYASLSPDEAIDVSTTVAERLGHNGKDGFSVAHFLTETSPKKMSDTTLVTLFGQAGAQSIKNLRTLGEQVNRVTGAMNSRTSKSGVAGDMRSWIASLVFGGGAGAIGGSGSAIATAVGVGAAKAGVDLLSARALMSPKITKWIAQTPATNSPRAINAHLERLSRIAANDNAIAAEAIGLRQVVEAAILGPSRAAAGQPVPLPQSGNEETARTPQ